MKLNKISFIACSIAVLAMATPAMTLAKNDKSKSGDNGNSNNKSENVLTKVGNAFGHLIAPGWIKKNGAPSNVDTSNLPPGISKKLNGDNNNGDHNGNGNDQGENDQGDNNHNGNGGDHNGNGGNGGSATTTIPVITNLVASSNLSTSATITWTTDVNSNSRVWFATTSPVVTSGTPNIIRNALVKNHNVTLNNLTPNTTYYVIVQSGNSAGSTFSGQTSFTTPVNPNPNVLTLSGVTATVLGQNQAQISWTTNEPAMGSLFYSTTTPVNVGTAQTVVESSSVYNHYVLLNNLSASTTYYFLVTAKDSSGNVATSSESSFTTSQAPVVNPLVISNAVAMIGSTSANLIWTTNIAADSQAYYSTTSPVTIGATSTTAVTNASLVTSHTLTVPNLATSTTYYMIIQSKDASNNVQTTGQFSFTTGQ